MNVKIIVKPQKLRFLRLTYFLTANLHLAENIVVIRVPRACGDDPEQAKTGNTDQEWTPHMRG